MFTGKFALQKKKKNFQQLRLLAHSPIAVNASSFGTARVH